MARILITSGPTRQYLDPVRFISNGSTGKMGRAIVDAAIKAGHEVIVVSGPVGIDYHPQATRIDVQTTQEMLDACLMHFCECDGMIAAAAPCDYQPAAVAENKLKKTPDPMVINLIPTADILATIGELKREDQWTIGFALESENGRENAMSKMKRKNCDFIVLNGPNAISAEESQVEILGPNGVIWSDRAEKRLIAHEIMVLFRE